MEARKKKSKFNSQELEVLIEEITLRLPQMIDSQQQGNIISDTNPIWEDILNKVNCVATTERSVEDLQKKWHDLSHRVVEQIAELKKHSERAEGTLTADLELTPFQEKVRQILLMANTEGLDTGAGEVIAFVPTTVKTAEEEKQLGAGPATEKTAEEEKKLGSGATIEKMAEEERKLGAGPTIEKTAEEAKKLGEGTTPEKTAEEVRNPGDGQLPTDEAHSLSQSQSIPLEQQNITDSQLQQPQNDDVPNEEFLRPPVHLNSQPDNGREGNDSLFLENYARQLTLLEEYSHQVGQHAQLFLSNTNMQNQLIVALTQHMQVAKDLNETISTFVVENQSVCRSLAQIATVPKPNWQRLVSILQPQNVGSCRRDLRPSGGTLQEARSNSAVEMRRRPTTRSQRSRESGLAPPAAKKRK